MNKKSTLRSVANDYLTHPSKKHGITLIALIITVIVLLILAGTAISIAINGGDIFSKTSQARETWNTAVKKEDEAIGETLNYFKTAIFADDISNKMWILNSPTITSIQRSSQAPSNENKNEKNIVSSIDSDYPIYMWNENGTLYWYCEAGRPKLPANCSNLFSGRVITDYSGIYDWDTSDVTNMKDMFGGCRSATSLDLSNFNTSNVVNMSGMFAGCSSLTFLNVSSFDTTNVTNMGNMFGGCCTLASLNVSNFNTENVSNMNAMFSGCASIQTLDISNFKTTSVTDMGSMFRMTNIVTASTRKLKTIIVSNDFVVKPEMNTTDMFKDTYSIVGGAGTIYDGSKIDGSMAHIDTAEDSGYFTSNQ